MADSLKPLAISHLRAERVGFEPTMDYSIRDFESRALDRTMRPLQAGWIIAESRNQSIFGRVRLGDLPLVSRPRLGVQYPSVARRSLSRRGGRQAFIPKREPASTGFVQLWTLAPAASAGVTCTQSVPGGFRSFHPRARANRSRVATRAGSLSPRRINP